MSKRRGGGGGGSGNQNQNQGQQGRGRGKGGGGQIPWHLLTDAQRVAAYQRQLNFEDEDRELAKTERTEAAAKEAKDKASEAAKVAKQNSVTVNAAVSVILTGMTFGFIQNPSRQRWNKFVGAISDTDRAHLYSVLAQMDEEGRKQAIKGIMQEEDNNQRLQTSMDRGLLPS